MDAQTNALVKSLIHMMWADGVIEEHEREFLGSVVSELGLARELLSNLLLFLLKTNSQRQDL